MTQTTSGVRGTTALTTSVFSSDTRAPSVDMTPKERPPSGILSNLLQWRVDGSPQQSEQTWITTDIFLWLSLIILHKKKDDFVHELLNRITFLSGDSGGRTNFWLLRVRAEIGHCSRACRCPVPQRICKTNKKNIYLNFKDLHKSFCIIHALQKLKTLHGGN